MTPSGSGGSGGKGWGPGPPMTVELMSGTCPAARHRAGGFSRNANRSEISRSVMVLRSPSGIGDTVAAVRDLIRAMGIVTGGAFIGTNVTDAADSVAIVPTSMVSSLVTICTAAHWSDTVFDGYRMASSRSARLERRATSVRSGPADWPTSPNRWQALHAAFSDAWRPRSASPV